ncbi:MAG TPA: alpha/beta fold hydrolase [Chloroflexota bacterium]|nr:alpha/beta fold hydrolase [Chloroflexota bacterium]
MPRRVTFFSDGIELVGHVYEPTRLEAGERRSGVVVCHGFGAHQERVLPEVARHLAERGYVAMTLDYRGFGESQGPRWRMIPQEQVSDIRNAITFLQGQPTVDPARIGLWGTSFGGANVAYVAGVDRRVNCTVSLVGVGCGERWLRSLRRAWEWRAFREELDEDWRRQVATGASRMVDRTYIMLPDPPSQTAIEATLEQFPDMCRQLPLETARAVLDFHPEEVVARIAPRPILFIVAGEDALVLNELTWELFERAGEPKKWVVIPDIPHYDMDLPENLDKALAHTCAWYGLHLPARASSA